MPIQYRTTVLYFCWCQSMYRSGCCHHTEGKVLFEVEFSAVKYLGLFQLFSTLSGVCSLTVSGFCSSMGGIQFIFSCHYFCFTTTYANFSVNHVMLLILAKVKIIVRDKLRNMSIVHFISTTLKHNCRKI